MKNLSKGLLIALGLLYPALFYDVGAGVNVLIYTLIVLAVAHFLNPDAYKNKYVLIAASSMLLLAIASMWHANHYTIWIHFLLYVILAGSLHWEQGRSLLYTSWTGLFKLLEALNFSSQAKAQPPVQASKPAKWNMGVIKKLSIYIIPLLVVVLFLRIYSNANEIFGTIIHTLFSRFEFIWDWIKDFFPKLNIYWILQFILGVYIARVLYSKMATKNVLQAEQAMQITATRKFKKPTKFYGLKLLNEYKAGMFLLICLNAILLFLNIIDINYVWLNFEFTGETLREFVHEGTLNLLVSILLSGAIVLYLFRGNLNFYSKNKWLKLLTIVWIAQNIFLTASVLMRNFHYINHYNLAYKRIGLLFFCILIIWAMLFIIVKVQKSRSNYYLTTRIFKATFVIVVFSAVWDWASIITKYNFNRAGKAYVHYNFLQTLPDRCLPMLAENMDRAFEIEEKQRSKFNRNSTPNNMEEYKIEVQNRIDMFKKKFNEASWKEWTVAEQQAYQKLQASGSL